MGGLQGRHNTVLTEPRRAWAPPALSLTSSHSPSCATCMLKSLKLVELAIVLGELGPTRPLPILSLSDTLRRCKKLILACSHLADSNNEGEGRWQRQPRASSRVRKTGALFRASRNRENCGLRRRTRCGKRRKRRPVGRRSLPPSSPWTAAAAAATNLDRACVASSKAECPSVLISGCNYKPVEFPRDDRVCPSVFTCPWARADPTVRQVTS